MQIQIDGGSYTANSKAGNRRTNPQTQTLIDGALASGIAFGTGRNDGWVATADVVNGEVIVHVAFYGLLAQSDELEPVAMQVAEHPAILRVRDFHLDYTTHMSVVVAIAAGGVN